METAGACFERCPGQAPAEVLMLGQLEASARVIVTQSGRGAESTPSLEYLKDGAEAQLKPAMALTSRYSSKPKRPHSRPLPDCL